MGAGLENRQLEQGRFRRRHALRGRGEDVFRRTAANGRWRGQVRGFGYLLDAGLRCQRLRLCGKLVPAKAGIAELWLPGEVLLPQDVHRRRPDDKSGRNARARLCAGGAGRSRRDVRPPEQDFLRKRRYWRVPIWRNHKRHRLCPDDSMRVTG